MFSATKQMRRASAQFWPCRSRTDWAFVRFLLFIYSIILPQQT